jgi:hypothetical protein
MKDSKIINEYGVITDKVVKERTDALYDTIRTEIIILTKTFYMTPPEMMILQRHMVGQVEGIWADQILRKQMEMKKNK